MKKIFSTLALTLVILGVSACSSETENDTTNESITESETTVEVSTIDADGNEVAVKYPTVIENGIVVLNYQTLDFVDALGLGDKIIGLVGTEQGVPDHLKKYYSNEKISNVGSMKDYNVETVASLKPDIIFSSDRTAADYDTLSKIAPVYCAFVDYKLNDFMEGYEKLAHDHAKIFGVNDKVDTILDNYNTRIEKIKEISGDQTALIALFTGGSINTLGDQSRCSIITRDMGFTNLANELDVNHGAESSYETYLSVNPDWIFVLDKDAAVLTEGTLAEDLMDNEIIEETNAFKNDQIVYLEPGNVWYTLDGGITSLDFMITCIEEALDIK